MPKKAGLYSNVNDKRKRIAAGSGERMRKVGAKGAPSAKAFKESAKTAKVGGLADLQKQFDMLKAELAKDEKMVAKLEGDVKRLVR